MNNKPTHQTTTHKIDSAALSDHIADSVRLALAEDCGPGDVSAQLIPDTTAANARVITREAGIFCGRAWVEATTSQVDERIKVSWHVIDGEAVTVDQVLFELAGPAPSLLTAERTLLNFVQLLSGTATKTARYVALLKDTGATLLDTRKTIPGLRLAQKYAVTCGGGHNHRLGLYDAFLLKENHIAAAGSITQAVAKARKAQPDMPVEVEVESLTELAEAIASGADIAMVDNFTIDETITAVTMAKGQIKLEASGGIDENSITAIARTGVDYISSGDLTKDITPLDLSMRFI
jgi:nicotinate-nucleotide pyrophosphorylase (carboxylating)